MDDPILPVDFRLVNIWKPSRMDVPPLMRPIIGFFDEMMGIYSITFVPQRIPARRHNILGMHRPFPAGLPLPFIDYFVFKLNPGRSHCFTCFA
jgi:hypothetical protein